MGRRTSRIDSRLLWFLFLLQIILIGAIFKFGTFYSADDVSGGASPFVENEDFGTNSVQFLEKNNNSNKGKLERKSDEFSLGRRFSFSAKDNFDWDFVRKAVVTDSNTTEYILCYKQGTYDEEDNNAENEYRCKCKMFYHGKDCTIPEVVFRPLLAKKWSVNMTRQVHNLFYIIRTTSASLETLEIQILELESVVDIFIICDISEKDSGKIRQLLQEGHMKSVRNKIKLSFGPNQTVESVLTRLNKSFKNYRLKNNDLILVSDSDEILNKRAITYLKSYHVDNSIVRFRLKYLVYGFFWQHPQLTVLKSFLFQYKNLNLVKSQFQMEKPIENPSLETNLIIGDLNHFGGFYCRVCYQPIDIVHYLNLKPDLIKLDSQHLKNRKHKLVDEDFVEKLIADGKNIFQMDDSQSRDLIRIHQRDKYFSPELVQQNAQKYDNLVKNIFEQWENDIVDNDYFL